MIDGYNKDKGEIEQRMKDRIKKVEFKEPKKPQAPIFQSDARAARRRCEFEAKMEREYGKDWRDGALRK